MLSWGSVFFRRSRESSVWRQQILCCFFSSGDPKQQKNSRSGPGSSVSRRQCGHWLRAAPAETFSSSSMHPTRKFKFLLSPTQTQLNFPPKPNSPSSFIRILIQRRGLNWVETRPTKKKVENCAFFMNVFSSASLTLSLHYKRQATTTNSIHPSQCQQLLLRHADEKWKNGRVENSYFTLHI